MKEGTKGGLERLARRVEAKGVSDPRVLEAVREVPRAAFVPERHARDSYRDTPLPIGRGQVTTQPSLSARMIEALELAEDHRVLEVGTGHGWQTALLARLASGVWSVERHDDLARVARVNLDASGVHNVRLRVGDGTRGWPDAGPFDAILVSAAFRDVPAPLAEQLVDGGRLVQPVGPGGADDVLLFVRGERGLERRRRLCGAHFVRLVGEYGFRE